MSLILHSDGMIEEQDKMNPSDMTGISEPFDVRRGTLALVNSGRYGAY